MTNFNTKPDLEIKAMLKQLSYKNKIEKGTNKLENDSYMSSDVNVLNLNHKNVSSPIDKKKKNTTSSGKEEFLLDGSTKGTSESINSHANVQTQTREKNCVAIMDTKRRTK